MSTGLIRAYQGASALALPFVARHRINHLRRAGLPVFRAHEILGHASRQRPLGPLVWINAASAQHAKCALPLISALHALQPDLRFLVTTVTPDAADLLSEHLTAGSEHQFTPLDAGGPTRRFLKHWRPDLGIFLGNELCPNTLETTAQTRMPLVLMNARISAGSRKRWTQAAGTARRLFGHFGVIHCQDRETEAMFHKLRLRHARRGVDLESVHWTPAVDPPKIEALRAAFGVRPLWLAAAPSADEEALVIDAHSQLRQTHPRAALILVPSDPTQVSRMRDLAGAHRLKQRSLGEEPDWSTSIYVADTPEYRSLWFHLAPICCLGGSFSGASGPSPQEAAAAHTALVHGPAYGAHSEALARYTAVHAALEVKDAISLSGALDTLFRDPERVWSMAEAAYPLSRAGQTDLSALARQCLSLAQIPAETPSETTPAPS